MTGVTQLGAVGALASNPRELTREIDGNDLSTIKLFGLNVANAATDMVLSVILDQNQRRRIAFLNAHCINVASGDPRYRQALETADMVLPDGAGISLAAKMNGTRIVENLNGTDLFPRLCVAAAARGLSVYLLGGADGRAEATAFAAYRIAPGLKIAGTQSGFFEPDATDEIIEQINASGADILLVGMGVPLQDAWLAQHADRLSPRLVMGVGGLFDYYSGAIPRAPRAIRSFGMEWAWRLAQEPARLAKRYLIGNFTFVARAAKHSLMLRGRRAASYDSAKRAIDVACAGAGLIALTPLFLLLAAAIRLESRGPVFFRQNRVGKDGVEFPMIKFRSMHQDAEARRLALLDTSERKGVCFKMKDDPRVTRIGRFIRKTSIDELPQLLNVLRGEMSLVGPRPALPNEVAQYDERDLKRLNALPGITGIWQISGRADISFKRMVEMDIAYAGSRSVLMDIIILALTAPALLSRRGAY